MDKFTFLWVDMLYVAFLLVLFFAPKISFFKQIKFTFAPSILTTSFFITWNLLFTQYHVWDFNTQYILGIQLFKVPLEEILLLFCMPYISLWAYFIIKKHLRFERVQNAIFYFSWVLIAGLFILGFIYYNKLYTLVVCFSLGLCLMVVTFRKQEILLHYFLSCAILLLLFFIPNAFLSGSFLNKTLLIYNKMQHLDVHILSLPVETFLYQMLLALCCIAIYEKRLSLENA
ncbi:MAG: lycopene cyclase domain-containing protein [Bacteroidetes bacterium]|nr:lycopene cyclase domain-containing protein [Bacteroidota bacterium]